MVQAKVIAAKIVGAKLVGAKMVGAKMVGEKMVGAKMVWRQGYAALFLRLVFTAGAMTMALGGIPFAMRNADTASQLPMAGCARCP